MKSSRLRLYLSFFQLHTRMVTVLLLPIGFATATATAAARYPPLQLHQLAVEDTAIYASAKAGTLQFRSPGLPRNAKAEVIHWTAKRRQFTLRGVDYGFTGLPILYYSPSTGWNYGMRLQWADYSRRPYRYKVTLFSQNSTARRLSYFVQLKVPRISGTGFGFRLLASVKRDVRARYYGLGNESEFNKNFVDKGSPEFKDQNYYHYILYTPRLLMSLLREVHGPVLLSVGFGLQRTDVDARGDSSFYIPDNTPDGVTDGVTGFATVTLNWDTRDDPVIPRSGTFHEWSYESSRNSLLGLFFERIDFQRSTFTDSRYFPLSTRFNLAHRTVLDVLKGMVPLYAYGEIGGSRRMKGLGGSDSLRGFDRQRFTDNVRLITNTEFRYHLRSDWMFKQYIDWHSVLFIDSGQVQPGLKRLAVRDLHWTAGIGQRFYWNSDFVIRFDVGFSTEQSYVGLKYRNIF